MRGPATTDSSLQQSLAGLEHRARSVSQNMAIRERGLSPRLLAESRKYEGKDTEINLNNIVKDKNDTTSEGPCRARIDYMIVACKLAPFEKYLVFHTERRSTPPLQKSATNLDSPLPVITYSEMDFCVEVEDRRMDG